MYREQNSKISCFCFNYKLRCTELKKIYNIKLDYMQFINEPKLGKGEKAKIIFI